MDPHNAQAALASTDAMAKFVEVAQIVSAGASVLGLVSIAFLVWQVNDTRKWNKLHFAFSFFPQPTELEQLEREIDSVTRFWRRKEPFTLEEVKALLGNLPGKEIRTMMANQNVSNGFGVGTNTSAPTDDELEAMWFDSGRKLKQYMNLIEMYACAINSGVADSQTAKMIYGFKFSNHLKKAKPYIEYVRNEKGDQSLFLEIENVIEDWYPTTKKPESAKKQY